MCREFELASLKTTSMIPLSSHTSIQSISALPIWKAWELPLYGKSPFVTKLIIDIQVRIQLTSNNSPDLGMLCEFGQQMDEYLKDGTYRQCSANPKIQNMTSIKQWYKEYHASRNYKLTALDVSIAEVCKIEPAFSLPKHRHNMQSSLTKFFTRHNLQAILVPSHPEVSAFTPANIAGYPTINLPIGFNSDGSSAGLTLYGPSNSNSLLLKLAQAFDSQTYRPKFLV
ncbi:putative amidase AmiA2 [Entomophthora muscae]|uniref:Amidase AmiA2 n=1 Tax=Entomophthora muscae TaxID=34485 RepID=A0ACC2TIE4_9FUNG|nr:putative amidase AmiA2 [Entomophthora muscae]